MPQFDPDEYLSEVTDAANSALVGFDFNAPLAGLPVYEPRPAIRAAQSRNPMRQIPRPRILDLPLPEKLAAPAPVADFDPDAYLAEITSAPVARVPQPADAFDPDEYLASIAPTAAPAAPAWQPMADTERAQLGQTQAEAALSADATRQAADDLTALYKPRLDAARKAARREGYTVPELSPAFEAIKAELKAQQASIGAEASGFDAVKRDLIAKERAGITPPVEQKPEFPDFMTWRQQEIDAGRMDPGASMVPDWIDAMIPQAAGALAQQAGGVLRTFAPSSRTLGDIGTALSDAGAAAKGMAAQAPGASGSIGRGAGTAIGLAAGTPTLRAVAPSTLTTAAALGSANAARAIQSTATIPMAQRAAQEAAESVRAAGGDKAAQDAAAQHALVMLPVYMAGGAAAARAGSRLAGPAAGPAMQTAVGTAASIAGNVGTSAALAAIEGGEYGLENLTVDSLFGILHGVGVWKGAKAQTRADAADILISRGVDPFAAAIDRIPRNTRAPREQARPTEPPAAEPTPDDGFDPVDMAPEAKQVHEDAIRQARESADPSLITPPMDPAQADAEAAALEAAMQRLAEPVQMGDTAGDAPLPEQKIASNPAPALAGDAGPARALSGEGERPATGEAQQGRAADIQQPAGAEPAQYGAQIEPMQPARKAGAGVSPADQAAAKARIEAEGWRVELEPVDDARQRVAIDRQSNRKPNAKPLKNPAAGWEARRRVTVFDAAGNKVAEFQGIGKETALWEAKTRIALDAGIEPPPPPKFRNPMQNLPPAPGGGEDVISYLWGTKIRSPKWYKDQGLPVPPEYDLIHSIPLPWRTLLFAKDGEKLDERAHEIRNTRGIGNGDEFGQFEHIETGGDMIAEILAAIKGREKTRDAEKAQIEEQKEPTRQANAFERDRVKPVKAAEKLTGDDLRVGEVLTLRGEELRVIELDPDTGTVTLDDGQKYGQQMLGENEVIYAKVKRRGNTAPETPADGGDSPFSRRGVADIEKLDRDYLNALKRGDTAQAQRMVDEAAKAAGYNVGPVWHGTRRQFNEFIPSQPRGAIGNKPGIYFSPDRRTAEEYAMDADGATDSKSRVIQAYIRNAETNTSRLYGTTEYRVDNAEDVKSADPVTYDDAGNVIPLSQRFNEASNDIRFSRRGTPKLQRGQDQGDLLAGTDQDAFNLAGERGTDPWRLQAERDAAERRAEEARLDAERRQKTMDLGEPAAPRPASVQIPRRSELQKPITGPSGARIVGYEWRSQVDTVWSDARQEYVARRVSDWDAADKSQGTGRDIVHVFYVEKPDGSISTEGIKSAQNILGISETKLQTIAKNERQARLNQKQRDDDFAASIEKAAPLSADEADRRYRDANNPDRMMWGTRAQHEAAAAEAFRNSVLLTKDGRFTRTGAADVIELLKERGWNEPPAVVQDSFTTAEQSSAVPQPPRIQPGRTQGDLGLEGRPTGAPKLQPGQRQGAFEFSRRGQSRAIETPENNPETFWKRVWNTVAPGPARDIALELRDPAELVRAGFKTPEQLDGSETAVYLSRQKAIWLLDEGISGRLATHTLLDVNHEAAHAWQEGFTPAQWAALERLWKAEVTNGEGPLFDEAGELWGNVNPDVFRSVKEWAAERAAHENLKWSEARAKAAEHDGSLIGKLAAGLRSTWAKVRLATTGERPDVITQGLREFLQRGRPVERQFANGRTVGPMLFSIRAYHGTPHNVDKFSTDKIGTGEGAQAYGWGLYFAENRQVAEQYRKILTNDIIRARDYLQSPEVFSRLSSAERRAVAVASGENLLSIAASKGFTGNLYRVELDAEPHELLKWDQSIYDQPAEVREALRRGGIRLPNGMALPSESALDYYRSKDLTDRARLAAEILPLLEDYQADYMREGLLPEEWDAINAASQGRGDMPELTRASALRIEKVFERYFTHGDPTGKDIYQALAREHAITAGEKFPEWMRGSRSPDPQAATRRLLEHGIKGIRYFDGGSRADGQGTENFVIFDDKLINITGALKEPGDGGVQFSRRNEPRPEDAKRDRDYLDAVKRGDTAQAQRLVDKAAKAAGYTIGPVGHGTGERFNTFRHEFGGTSTEAKSAKEAFFFSDGERTPKSYAVYAAEQGPIKALMRQAEQAEKRGDWDAYERLIEQAEDMTYGEAGAESTMKRRENARVLRVYLKGRFMELDAEGKSPQELGDTNQFSEFDGSITAAIKSAKRKGYDGLIIRNLDDAAGVTEVSNHFAVFDSNQIKLADPVTYDDAGQPIPLSKRFRTESDDIRFSTRGDKGKAERDQRILDAMKGKPGGPMPAPNAGRGDPFESVVPDAALPRASRVWRGVADVFDEVKGLGFLADAIRKHVDRQRMLQGKVTAPFRQWEQRHGRAERRKAEQEFEAYQRKLDQERDPDLVRDLNRGKIRQTGADTGGMSSDEYRRQASPAGRELIEAWDGIASRVQKRNQALNVMARGADGHWKPIGTVTQYYPRSLRPDILRALRNPKGNRKAYAELARELYDAGLIKDAREAQQFIQTHFRTESQFDHLGNIEAARAVKMPTKLYDYTFAAARRYLMGWTERIAQIEAFGQKTTKTSKDVFDVAMDRMIGNEPVQEYIDAARKLAYSERSQTVWAKALRLMNTAAAGLQLGNPITVGVNLASGLAYNASHFGYANAMRGFWELRKLGQQINEAHEAGVLLDDLMGIAEDARGSGSKAEEAAAAMTRGLLNVSGYNASETFVRAHGYATAQAFLRQYLKDPGNGQFRRFFERNKLNADKLAAENGRGPETDRFLRRAVYDAQGGYRYDQVPVFTDTPIGRFLFKYQKWGTQALRNFMINTSPLVGRAKDPAAWASAARYLLTTALVGWGIEGAKTALFGVSPRTAGLVEIAKTADEDEKRAWALATQKAWRSMMAAGAFGILGNYVQIATDVAERSRFKNPLDPPGLAAAKGAGELLMTAYEQGKLTSGDALDFLGKQVSLARVLKAGVARAVEAAGGTDNAPRMIQDETTRQNLSWSAGIVRRFLDEQGVEATRTQLGRVASSPLLPYKRAVVQAIHRGDLPGGREAIADYLSRLAPQDRKAAQRALERYVATKQPLKVDGSTSAMREAFIRWAQRRLDTGDFLRLMRMDQGYRTTAKQLGLMDTPKKPTEADLEKALQRRKMPR